MTPEELKEELEASGFDVVIQPCKVPDGRSRSFHAVKHLSDIPYNELRLVVDCKMMEYQLAGKMVEDCDHIKFALVILYSGSNADAKQIMARILDLNENRDCIVSDWKAAAKDIVEKELGLLEKTYARLAEFNMTGI